MASAPASHPGRAVGSPGGPAPAAGARATETLEERPRPSSSPSPTSPTRATTVEDSRRIDPILVPAGLGASVQLERHDEQPGRGERGGGAQVVPCRPAAEVAAPPVGGAGAVGAGRRQRV